MFFSIKDYYKNFTLELLYLLGECTNLAPTSLKQQLQSCNALHVLDLAADGHRLW
jgi:hypothetical protein